MLAHFVLHHFYQSLPGHVEPRMDGLSTKYAVVVLGLSPHAVSSLQGVLAFRFESRSRTPTASFLPHTALPYIFTAG